MAKCSSERQSRVDVGKARHSIMTYAVSALNIRESADPTLHPLFSPLPLALYNSSITLQTFESSQMAPVRYSLYIFSLILSSIPSTAAKERSRRDIGVYSVYYGNTPQHLRPEALRKWMESVTSSPENA
jgi:hypothetical protein